MEAATGRKRYHERRTSGFRGIAPFRSRLGYPSKGSTFMWHSRSQTCELRHYKNETDRISHRALPRSLLRSVFVWFYFRSAFDPRCPKRRFQL
jgi:hypothetical protein